MDSLDSFFQPPSNALHAVRHSTVTNSSRQFRAKHTISIPEAKSLALHCGSSVADTADTQSNGDEYFQFAAAATADTPYFNLVPHGRESISPTPKAPTPSDAATACGTEHALPPIMAADSNRSTVTSNSSLFHHSTASRCREGVAASSGSIDDEIARENREEAHHPLLGMILVTLSALCYAALNLSVKALMLETPWQELMFIRMSITWSATMVWILAQYRGRLRFCGPSHQRLWLLVRALFLWGAMFCCWWSFEFLPVGDGTTLAMSFPVWVSLFAHFVWKNESGAGGHPSSQRLDLFGWICVLCGFLGIAFVARPTFIFGATEDDDVSRRDVGIAIAMVSAICAGAQYVIVNYTKRDCHWLQVEQVTSALSVFVLCPFAALCFSLYFWAKTGAFKLDFVTLSAVRWVEEIGLGLLGFGALALLTRGSQLDAPSRTAICLYLEIPFVYIGQCAMTRQLPTAYVFVGIFLVVGSVVVPAIRKLRARHRERERSKMDDELEAVNNALYDDDREALLPLLDDHGDKLMASE